MEDCIFCKIVTGVIPSAKVYENDKVIAFRDINPQAKVHVLVVPKTHVTDVAACISREDDMIGDVYRAAVEVARLEGIAEGGFRLVTNCGETAGQTVGHFHVHVLGGETLSGGMA